MHSIWDLGFKIMANGQWEGGCKRGFQQSLLFLWLANIKRNQTIAYNKSQDFESKLDGWQRVSSIATYSLSVFQTMPYVKTST